MSYKDRDVLQFLLETMNDPQIATLYGVSEKTIGYWRRQHGLPRSTSVRNIGNRKYTVDENFFATIDTEAKAYTLGMIVTDGWIGYHRTSKVFGIQLKESDRPILESIRDAMQSTHPVKTVLVKTGYSPHEMATFVISNKFLVAQLESLGLHPNKTDTIGYLSVPPEMDRHFIRGLIDGDGNVNHANFQLAGTKALIEGTIVAIKAHTDHALSFYVNRGRHIMVGYRRDASVLRWIYQDSTLALPRKRELYQTYWA